MKTAEEIAEKILRAAHVHFPSSRDKDTCAKCGNNFREHLALDETLKDRVAKAILADRKQRDKKVIEVLEPFDKWAAYYNRYPCLDNYEIHFSHSDVGNVLINVGHLRQASALLAELRKEKE